mgnify:CR=1 FL=1
MRKIKELETTKAFSNNLRRRMVEQNITGARMAKDLDINKSSISQWMNGKNFPSPDTIKRIAEYLNTTINELYGQDAEEKEITYSIPNSINTFEEARDFLKSLNLYAYGGIDLTQKSENDIITLARTILSTLQIQGKL